MSNTPEEASNLSELTPPEITPIKNLIGSAIAAAFSTLAYLFTQTVAVKLAHAPLTDVSTLATKLAVLVRTFLLAVGSGITMMFGIIAAGLVLLTVQQLGQQIWQKIKPQPKTMDSD